MVIFTWLFKAPRSWCFCLICFILVVNITINVIYLGSVLKFSGIQEASHANIQELQENPDDISELDGLFEWMIRPQNFVFDRHSTSFFIPPVISVLSTWKEEFSFFPKDRQKPFQGQIIVHIDLKGAPPRVSYLMEFIPFIRHLGATGILVEYEDTFPYDDGLEDITARNAYTREEIIQITTAAVKNNLTIIPLLPTLNHFEFVLKLEQYKAFREVEENPEILCPSQKDIYPLLEKMIDQMLEMHQNAKYLHIGCDEPDFIGMCHECRSLMRKNKWRAEDIYFDHVRRIAEYIANTYPGVRPVIWGHKFVKENEHMILAHKIPDLVDVMLYNHKSDGGSFIKASELNSFARIFKNIWVAGAFKGASGSTRLVTNPEFHLKNTKSWMKIITKWRDKINFKGYVFAGWQRYNHFSALCELLPIGIPSLALSLQHLISASDIDHEKIRNLLECNDYVPISIEDTSDEALLGRLQCGFPGYKVYQLILHYSNKLRLTQALQKFIQTGSFSFYNNFNNITDFNFVQQLNEKKYELHLLEINLLEKKLKKTLNEVYDEYTVDEWLMVQVLPKQMHLEAAVNTIKIHKNKRAWPRRPFKGDSALARKFFREFCNSKQATGCAFFNLI